MLGGEVVSLSGDGCSTIEVEWYSGITSLFSLATLQPMLVGTRRFSVGYLEQAEKAYDCQEVRIGTAHQVRVPPMLSLRAQQRQAASHPMRNDDTLLDKSNARRRRSPLPPHPFPRSEHLL